MLEAGAEVVWPAAAEEEEEDSAVEDDGGDEEDADDAEAVDMGTVRIRIERKTRRRGAGEELTA